MAVYAIADLHLSLGVDKPMDVFGGDWVDYMDKIRENWNKTVSDDDVVLVVGDISWATYLSNAREDFAYLEELPGRKLIIKGNHDYWWNSARKMDGFLKDNGFHSVKILNNEFVELGGVILCGTRGWKCPTDPLFTTEDKVLYERELLRLEMLMKAVSQKRTPEQKLIVGLHFPPFDLNLQKTQFNRILEEYGVDICAYGHLHNIKGDRIVQGSVDKVEYIFVAGDYLKFCPQKLI